MASTRRGGNRRRRKPNRIHEPHTLTLPPSMVADLAGRARTATARKDRSLSGQVVRAYQRSLGVDLVLRQALAVELAIAAAAAAELRDLLALPQTRRRVDLILRALDRAGRLTGLPAAKEPGACGAGSATGPPGYLLPEPE